MDKQLAERQEAVRRYLAGEGMKAIGSSLSHSPQWVRYWIEHYNPDDVVGSLTNRSSRPHEPHFKWSARIRAMVVGSRVVRQTKAYALISAEAIHYELRALGITPLPPVRTIHYWLKQADLIQRPAPMPPASGAKRPYPALARAAVNDLHQLDLKGPVYLQDDSHKYYIAALRDFASKRVALGLLTSRQTKPIVAFTVAAWRKMGCPATLQLDNGLEFRGSNRYPRSFGELIQLCLQLDVEPCFIPHREPWRNGLIENLNGQLMTLVLRRQRFDSPEALQRALTDCELAINATHRLPALEGATPEEFCAKAVMRPVPATFKLEDLPLPLDCGSVAFIRLVRKSGRITLFADDKFDLDPVLQAQYVLARVVFPARKLSVFSHDNQLLKVFSF